MEILQKRIQSLKSPNFDVAAMRAVGDPSATVGEAPFLAKGGLLLVWTTDSSTSRSALEERFSAGSILRIPGSQKRRIAVYEKR